MKFKKTYGSSEDLDMERRPGCCCYCDTPLFGRQKVCCIDEDCRRLHRNALFRNRRRQKRVMKLYNLTTVPGTGIYVAPLVEGAQQENPKP